MVLGFLAHGYATHEFEVTAERLGVYLPVRLVTVCSLNILKFTFPSDTLRPSQTEHIDNPKGYGEDEDARKYQAAHGHDA